MNLCFIICGLPRCLELTLFNIEKKFSNHNINYYICITKNYNSCEKEYVNSINIDNIIKNKNLKKILFLEDLNDNSFRNSINYMKKIYDITKIVEEKYDLYIILRSDLSFDDISFLDDINSEQIIYFSKSNFNNYTKSIDDKINDNIIICKKIDYLKKIIFDLYNQLLKNNNFIEIVLFEYFNYNKINYKLITINYKLILSKCNIIAISGDSGSGKSTLSNYLLKLFNDDNYSKIETDRYHKWERGNENYLKYTHLNPNANHLEKMNDDIFKLKIGHEIYTVDYNHDTGKFTQEEKIESKNNIILCGLHTLYNDNTNNILDLKIFLDTDRELIKKWKIKRDIKERGYSIDKVLKQLIEREDDYEKYIKEQKKNADIIINFYEEKNLVKCNSHIKNINNQLIIKLLFNKYKLDLKDSKINIKLDYDEESNNYFKEICNIIKLILFN
jgi:uridine kinase